MLSNARFTSTRLEDGNMASYGVGLLSLAIPGLLMLLVLGPCWWYWRGSHRHRAPPDAKRTGWKWRTALGVAVAAAVTGLILSMVASASARRAVGGVRTVHTDASALVDVMDFQLDLLRNRTLALAPAVAPLITAALALPAGTNLSEIDSLRATAAEIQARIVVTADVVAAVNTARGALADARFTLSEERDAVRSIGDTGTVAVYVVGLLLLLLFVAGAGVSAWSVPNASMGLGVALGLFVLLALPMSTAVGDGCGYYGNLDPRAQETSAVALACLRDTDLLVAAGASVDALSPDTYITFPMYTSVNTSLPYGPEMQTALDGMLLARDALTPLFDEMKVLRNSATCGPISTSATRFRDDLCASPPLMFGAVVCAIALYAAAFAGLFLWAPPVAYAKVGAVEAAAAAASNVKTNVNVAPEKK
jgi:hypothetical protein